MSTDAAPSARDPDATRRRMPALRHRDFAIFMGGSFISRVGTQMQWTALAWHVWLLTGSPLALGWLGACKATPIISFALVGGMAADVYDRRKVMLVMQLVMLSTSTVMAIATATGTVSVDLLYGLVVVSGVANAFDNPARQSQVVSLLPPEDLPNGLAIGILGWQLATVVGPPLAGLLLAVQGPQAVYAVDAASFLSVLAALLLMRPVARTGPRVVAGFSAAAEGLRFVRRTPILMWIMGIDFVATFFAGSLLLLPIYADRILHVGEWGLGWLLAAPAFGAWITAGMLSWLAPIRRQGLALLVAVAAYGASIAFFGISRSFWLSLALLAASGAADTVSTVVRQTVRQTVTPDALRGRVNATNMIFFVGGPQLGELEAGFVAQLAGAPFSVVSGGVVCLAMAAIVAFVAPSVRDRRSDTASDMT